MPAAIASPDNAINTAAKELTETQIEIAQQLCVKHKISDADMFAAVLTNLALNLQSLKK